MKNIITCPQCKNTFIAENGRINRARKINAPLYCGKDCAGKGRRLKNPPSEEERKAAKAEYDRRRRMENHDEIKRKKREYYYRNHDVISKKLASYRKENMHRHVEYCRQPEYKKYKKQYDRKYRANKFYGEYAEAFLLLQDIDGEIKSQSDDYGIRLANGTLNKAQQRRRALS